MKFFFFLLFGFLFFSLLFGVRTILRLFRFFFGSAHPHGKRYQNNQRTANQNQDPETQEDRIISYQKKNFESIAPEDVDFEEVKEKENR